MGFRILENEIRNDSCWEILSETNEREKAASPDEGEREQRVHGINRRHEQDAHLVEG